MSAPHRARHGPTPPARGSPPGAWCRAPTSAHRASRPFAAACAALCLAACGRGAAATHAEAVRAASDVLAWGRTIALAETPDAINVLPVVSLDPRGGFLVVDPREAQVRRYAPDGRLLWHFGRKGGGPGEFRAPVAVRRLASGEVLVLDRSERATFLDSAGAAVTRTARVPLAGIEDLKVVDDSLVLIAGVLRGDQNSARLHLYDTKSARLVASFFSPFRSSPNRVAAMVAGWSSVAIRGDTVAATFATSDTVYLFTTAGRPLGKIPIPFATFRHVPRGSPRGDVDPGTRARWLSSFDYVTAVYWLPDGRLLIPFQSLEAERALERRYHLFCMTRSGRPVFEVRDVPRLLAVDPHSADLYFVSPGAEVPNRWSVARLKL